MKKTTRFPAIFGIVCGIAMFAQWAMFLLTGQVPELQTAPFEIAFHLTAEGITALGLIFSGVLLLRKKSSGKVLYAVFSGMLLYSVVVSSGYFAELGQWGFVVMFMGLLFVSLLCLFLLFSPRNGTIDERKP